MKKEIKLWYSDFYEGFKPSDNYLQKLLSKKYQIILEPKNPDYLFYSCYGKDFLNYDKSVKIYYTGENLIPDFNLCDYAIGFSHLKFEDRYLRYPNFAFFEEQFKKLLLPKNITPEDLNNKEHFCNFIYANSHADPARDTFFHLLGRYKKVVSPGKHLNNASFDVGERFSDDWMYSKLSFQSKCKFSIAFENSSSPGYTTEKLMHAFISNTIPIYWGDPQVSKDFNSHAFINCHEFNSYEDVVQKIIEIDQNEKLSVQMLNAPPFANNEFPRNLKPITLQNFLDVIFDQDLIKSFRRPQFGTTLKYEREFQDSFLIKKNYRPFSPLKKLIKF